MAGWVVRETTTIPLPPVMMPVHESHPTQEQDDNRIVMLPSIHTYADIRPTLDYLMRALLSPLEWQLIEAVRNDPANTLNRAALSDHLEELGREYDAARVREGWTP